ncbi:MULTISPECIES: sugar phosphate isomerase/epimerase family protein [Glycomyces]|uniref:Sugar phosphate isomerase/epimerase n=2 Tax=Glycomyces TaxID=58113 RepID=A0A9X3PM73_9ACTN|nr:sugar phosphate isomerase/epimerase [Glycomyces lechevalierae]MDA1386133.1 sugar phosphate isomerase/epimerase [Glycomyces lechevalierae]MDR7338393.1 sugar phosphate isomerase/epimerase [Glycomyces lechevalierae]
MTQSVPVLLSTTSVYPEPTAVGFELAAELGYDGVELMVFTDRVSQDPAAAASLAKHYGVKIGAVHAPCLLVTQRVWSSDPWTRLRRSVQAAEYLDSPTVVIHPPFSWQKEYASKFSTVLDGLKVRYPHVTIAVENMFPLKLGKRKLVPYRPHWDPTRHGYDSYTLDLSHCAASGADAIAMAERMGKGLRHIHLCDGTEPGADQHLVPGRGTQPCAELLGSLGASDWDGSITVEVSTRKSGNRTRRAEDLYESLKFAKDALIADRPA